MLTMDGLLCLWTTAALAAAHTALFGRRLRLGWWLALGRGVRPRRSDERPRGPGAGRGADGGLCPAGARTARITLRQWAAYLGVVVAVAGPWYAAIACRRTGFRRRRSSGSTTSSASWRPFDHAEPIWFHLPPLLLGMLPWTLLVARLSALPLPAVGPRRGQTAAGPRLLRAGRPLVAGVLLRRRLQTGRLHPAGLAAARPGAGLLSQRPDRGRFAAALVGQAVSSRFAVGVPGRIAGVVARRRRGPAGALPPPDPAGDRLRPGRRVAGRRVAGRVGSGNAFPGRSCAAATFAVLLAGVADPPARL